MAEPARPTTSGVGEDAPGTLPAPHDAEFDPSLPEGDERAPVPPGRASTPPPATDDAPEPEREDDGWLPL